MKKMQCEVCASNDIIKQEGCYVCQSCGCKYTTEEARSLLLEVKEIADGKDNISKKVLDQIDDLNERQNELYIVFPKDSPEVANYRVLEYLRDTDYVSDKIFEDLSFGETSQSYAIIAMFGGKITYHWTASSGYDREEIYTEYEEQSEYINGRTVYKKVPVTKKRIVTDWRPSNGTVSDHYFNEFIVNSNDFYNDVNYRIYLEKASEKNAKNAVSLLKVCKEIPNGEELYNSLKANIQSVKNTAVSVAERSSGRYDIPGDHYKDVNETVDFRLETFFIVLYPIFNGEYIHKDKTYKFSVDAVESTSTSLSAEYPVQNEDKEKHELIIKKAKIQKNDKILKKQKQAKTVIGMGWGLSIPLIINLFIKWANNGEPSILFPVLILIAAIIWHFAFRSKFNKDISNINYVENKNIEKARTAIKNANQYKKVLRQNSFIDYIKRSNCEIFDNYSKEFVAQKSNTDNSAVDKILLNLNEYEEQERTRERTKETAFPESCKLLWAFFIICLFIGGGFFIATILNIFNPTSTKLALGIIGTIIFSFSWLFFYLGNKKVRKVRLSEGLKCERNKNASIISIVSIAIILFIGLFSIVSPSIKKANIYSKANKMVEAGDYESAYVLLDGLDYKDSNKKLKDILPQYHREILKKAGIGDTVFWGRFEQDNNTSNGQEIISWKVIAKEENKLLVISEYALDCKQYNIADASVTWETCSLRSWLNETFLNTAFNEKERSLIQTTTVSDVKLTGPLAVDPGNATQDKIYLLSTSEVKEYFYSNSERICKVTEYAKDNGVLQYGSTDGCSWWLRSPGYYQNKVAVVLFDGSIGDIGAESNKNNYGVRPVMWVNLDL